MRGPRTHIARIAQGAVVEAADVRAVVAAAVSERDWQAQVMAIAKRNGWYLAYHVWDPRHSPAGFPDCLFIRGNRLVVAELKREGQDPTKDQLAWLKGFADVGAATCIWRPADADAVERVLA